MKDGSYVPRKSYFYIIIYKILFTMNSFKSSLPLYLHSVQNSHHNHSLSVHLGMQQLFRASSSRFQETEIRSVPARIGAWGAVGSFKPIQFICTVCQKLCLLVVPEPEESRQPQSLALEVSQLMRQQLRFLGHKQQM